MKNSVYLKSLVAASLLVAASFASAAGENPYVMSAGAITKTGSGLCLRAGHWTPAAAQSFKLPGQQFAIGCECDKDLMPKAACTAPAKPAPAPAPKPAAPAPKPAPKPAPTSQKVTFAADAFFDFDKSVVKPEGKKKLDGLVGQLSGVTLEVIIAVGHTDSVGSDAYNQKLSVRRAEAVKAYLVSKGIAANRIYTEGKGEKQPVASNKTAAGRAKNRRVEIEVVGTRKR
ncbi:MAG: outer membrane protein OmpA [Quisquiliibacterium sp.]